MTTFLFFPSQTSIHRDRQTYMMDRENEKDGYELNGIDW